MMVCHILPFVHPEASFGGEHGGGGSRLGIKSKPNIIRLKRYKEDCHGKTNHGNSL